MKIRVAYVCFGVLSPTRAHNVQVTRTVEALAVDEVDVVFVNPLWFEPCDDLPDSTLSIPRVRRSLLPRTQIYAAYRARWQSGRFWALFVDRSVYALRAARAVRREHACVVITRDIVVCAWFHLLRPWLGSPVIYEAHSYEQILFGPVFDRARTSAPSSRVADFSLDQSDLSLAGRAYIRFLRGVEDWAIRRAAEVITLTHTFADELSHRLGISRPAVIPSGHDGVATAADRSSVRRRLGLPIDGNVALYAGLSFGGKSPAYLLDVAEHLPPHVTIVILGGTPAEHEEIRDEVRARSMTRVIARPRVSRAETLAYMQAADVGLLVYPDHPSLGTHASPLKAVEYLAAGVPVLATDSPAARELVDHGTNGWLVPRDARAIATALVAAVADPARLATARSAARASVQGRDYASRGRRIAELVRRVAAR